MFALHAISPGNETVTSFIDKALQVYDVVDFIHLRERHWTVSEYARVIEAIQAHDETLAKLIVNDRVDIATSHAIKRVHLPWHSHDPKIIQTHFPHLQYGCSVHDVKTAKLKEEAQADYVMYGHIFPTKSKTGLQARGIANLQEIVQALSIPVIAIGGITPDNIDTVMKAGANGAAVMSGIFVAENCREQALAYKEKINKGKGDTT